MEQDLFRGVYEADRAAALSGVPRSTVYYWARHDVWAPSLRTSRPKLWTYADVIALRLIYWLRREKPDIGSPSSMTEVRQAIAAIRAEGSDIWREEVRVFVDTDGHVFFHTGSGDWRASRPNQSVFPSVIEILGEFQTDRGLKGPNLVRPRPHLRIIPGKLSGEPHVEKTRISSVTVASLFADGLDVERVLRLYPDLTAQTAEECWDLERQLQTNLAA